MTNPHSRMEPARDLEAVGAEIFLSLKRESQGRRLGGLLSLVRERACCDEYVESMTAAELRSALRGLMAAVREDLERRSLSSRPGCRVPGEGSANNWAQ
jgi:hypothetical protein